MNSNILKSYAKINLFLDIVGKRDDNYHLIESLFHTVSLYDEIIITENSKYSIKTSGVFELDGSEENIVTKVFNYFKNSYNLKNNYFIEIVKNIPTGAGLGGGSSNAATVIKYLNDKIKKPLSNRELTQISTKFGADVAFFINGGCKWASGIGEILTTVNKLPYHILLVYPDIHISTKDAYSRFNFSMFDKGSFIDFRKIIDRKNINFIELKNSLYNVFEENIYSFNSDVKNKKDKMEKLLDDKVVMSGSGSCLFILYNDKLRLKTHYNILKENMKELKYIYALNLI